MLDVGAFGICVAVGAVNIFVYVGAIDIFVAVGAVDICVYVGERMLQQSWPHVRYDIHECGCLGAATWVLLPKVTTFAYSVSINLYFTPYPSSCITNLSRVFQLFRYECEVIWIDSNHIQTRQAAGSE